MLQLHISDVHFDEFNLIARRTMQYLNEAANIWRECVPKSGQADTIEGELLRAVEKLRDEAIRNGNQNWDPGFGILLSFLESKLLDKTVYSEATLAVTR